MIAPLTHRRRMPRITLALGAMVCLTALLNSYAQDTASTAPAVIKQQVEGGYFLIPVSMRPPVPRPVTTAFIIPIRGPIDPFMYESVKRKVLQCRGKGAELVIFDIDTGGGSIASMLDITDLIVEDLRNVRTVAYVNTRAISAGAIIASACNDLVMAPNSSIGAAVPIMSGPTGPMDLPGKIRNKFEAALEGIVSAVAENTPNRIALLKGMISEAWELWLVKNTATGQLQVVDAATWRHKVRGWPPSTQPALQGYTVPTDAAWVWVDTVVGPAKPVMLPRVKALNLGFADGFQKSLEDLEASYHVDEPATYLADSAAEKFVAFINSQWIKGALMLGLVFFGYMEMHTPGFGIFGSLAIACLALLVASQVVIGTANAIEIIVLVVGMILLALEIFVVPGFGVLGIGGIILMVGALAAMVIPNAPTEFPMPKTDLDWSRLADALLTGILGALAGGVLCAIAAKFLPVLPGTNKLFLRPAAAEVEPSLDDSSPLLNVHAGDTGVVETVCRPSGKARFGEDLLDVVSEGSIIAAGKTVRVLHRRGNEIVVEEA